LTLGIALVVSVAVLPALTNGWVSWDDDHNFHQNYGYRNPGWPGLKWAWTTSLLGVYQPVSWMLLEVEYAIGGLSPSVYHGTSLGLHVANAIVLYLLVRTLIARCPYAGSVANAWEIRASSTLAVVLFAVHPLRVETVAWISCQPYLLCAFFSITAVLAYLRACVGEGPPRRPWLILSLAASTAAMLSKAPAIILPAVLAILDVYPLQRLGRPGCWLDREASRVWQEKSPFWALSLLFGMIAVRSRLGVVDLTPDSAPGLGWRLVVAGYAAGFYLAKTVLPFGLSAVYMPPTDLTRPLLVSLLVVGMTIVALQLRRRWPALLTAWAIYLVALVPSFGVVMLGHPILADRYTYLASVAWVPLLAHGLLRSCRRGGPCAVAALGVIGAAMLIALIPLTWRQCRTWRSSEALWTQVVAYGGADSLEAHRNLADARLASGRAEEAIRAYIQAYTLATRYISEHPLNPRGESLAGAILNNLGNAFEEAHRHAQALDAYRRAIEHQTTALQREPDCVEYRLFLGNHHVNLGRLQARLGNRDAALRSLERARDLRARLARDQPAEDSFQRIKQRTEDEIRTLKDGRAAPAGTTDECKAPSW